MPDGDGADEALLAAVDVARAALLEITPSATVGEPIGHVVEGEHVLSLLFANTQPGYRGWHWTVTIARVDEESAPSVLEVELLPGEDALLAPDWVPWSERLADYQAEHAGDGEEAAEDDEESEEGDDLDDDDDALDDDVLDVIEDDVLDEVLDGADDDDDDSDDDSDDLDEDADEDGR